MGPRLRFTPITPHPNQNMVLLNELPNLALGGGHGGGKTTSILAAAAQYADVPGYEALIVRANYTDLRLPAGIMDMARQWFSEQATCDEINHGYRFSFTAGGAISILGGGIEQFNPSLAERRYQYIGIDEAQEFPTDAVYEFLQTLLGPPAGESGSAPDVPLRMRTAFTSHDGGLVTDGAMWVHQRFLDRTTRDVPVVPLNYSDNPAVDSRAYEEMLGLLP